MQYRPLAVLTIAQIFAQCAVPMVVLLGGIVGAQIAPVTELATLPVALMIVGTAATSIPAALLMSKIGRQAGFIIGAAYAAAAGVLAAYAISTEAFYLFCVATFLIGSHNAFIQQYRYAVAESVAPDKVAPAISILMLAGIGAAYLGPEAAQRMKDVSDWGEYSGSFLALSALMMVTLTVLLFYRGTKLTAAAHDAAQRPLLEIIGQGRLILAVCSSAVALSVMSFIMTATPLSMHHMNNHSLQDTTWVIQSHIMAMYLPSLFSGMLIARFGPQNIMAIGVSLILASLGVGYIDQQITNYWWALVLLGVGWNFMFLGGTTLLTQSYRPSERFKVQAFNDFLVFSLQAIAALSSGLVLVQWGWNWILALSLPWLICLIPVLWMVRRSVSAKTA